MSVGISYNAFKILLLKNVHLIYSVLKQASGNKECFRRAVAVESAEIKSVYAGISLFEALCFQEGMAKGSFLIYIKLALKE